MCAQDGSPLPMGQQLHWIQQLEILLPLHLVCLIAGDLGHRHHYSDPCYGLFSM